MAPLPRGGGRPRAAGGVGGCGRGPPRAPPPLDRESAAALLLEQPLAIHLILLAEEGEEEPRAEVLDINPGLVLQRLLEGTEHPAALQAEVQDRAWGQTLGLGGQHPCGLSRGLAP